MNTRTKSPDNWRRNTAEVLERAGIAVQWDGLSHLKELPVRLRGSTEDLGTISQTSDERLLVRLNVFIAHPQHDFRGALSRLRHHFRSFAKEGAKVDERAPMEFFEPWKGFCLDRDFDDPRQAAEWIKKAVEHGLVLNDPSIEYDDLVLALERLVDVYDETRDRIYERCSFALARPQWEDAGEVPEFETCDLPGVWVAVNDKGKILDVGVTEVQLLEALQDEFDLEKRRFHFAPEAAALWTWAIPKEDLWMVRWISTNLRRLV
jgi:hypothetical protein